jgi:hypothetical protein
MQKSRFRRGLRKTRSDSWDASASSGGAESLQHRTEIFFCIRPARLLRYEIIPRVPIVRREDSDAGF